MKFGKHKKRGLMLMSITFIMVISIYLHWLDNQGIKQSDTEQLKVFTPDWDVAVSLMMMRHPPIAIGDKRIYPVWVGQPKLPESIIDIGIRGQPNVELLAYLHPDVILDTAAYKTTRSVYDPNIPVYEVNSDIERHKVIGRQPKWSDFADSTRMMATILKEPELVEEYLADSKKRIIQSGEIVRQHIGNSRRIVVAYFWDARELSVYTTNSHTSLAADMMGLKLFSIGSEDLYGSTSVPMHMLYEIPDDVCLFITEPIPETTKYEIAHSPIWQRSKFFSPSACVYKLDPISNGGIGAMVNFAENLEKAVTTQRKGDFSYTYVTQTEGEL
ncbi:ABC transporter substrate-binding protein [Psychrobacter sp. I-STPA10]|uniref:ABC transporter substrate-binding protein n=1 Tax=Psychrobacter sp. I-STPA10 TaxID=2585769 RepID=UPI001E45D040|nr:ABC transporter substrate-binding protein [Psychrobacter sp. I-STPA10]